jgi:hypothetical protein
LNIHENIKGILNDYQRALEDLGKVYVLEPNNVITLSTCENVKRMLGDYRRTLEDLVNVDVLKDVLR